MDDDASSAKTVEFPTLRGLTPVLVVKSVNACLPFWTDRLGFTMINHVPGPSNEMIFAILERDGIEIMYQNQDSVLEDGTMTEAELAGHSVGLYLTVASIDDVEKRLGGVPVVKARHDTFYGSTEIYVKEPGGNTVGFAQHMG